MRDARRATTRGGGEFEGTAQLEIEAGYSVGFTRRRRVVTLKTARRGERCVADIEVAGKDRNVKASRPTLIPRGLGARVGRNYGPRTGVS